MRVYSLSHGLWPGLWRSTACTPGAPRKPWLRCLARSVQVEAQQSSSEALSAGDVLQLKCTGLSSDGAVRLEWAVSRAPTVAVTPGSLSSKGTQDLPQLQGVCRTGSGCVVFVDRALPGEVLEARLTLVKKSFARANKVASLSQHNHAVPAPCRHFGPCGGCSLQSLDYVAQLQHKQQHVVEVLSRVGRVENAGALVRPVVPCGQQYGYRNKMEFSFSTQRWQPAEAQEQQVPPGQPGRPGHEHKQLQRSGQRQHLQHQGSNGSSSPSKRSSSGSNRPASSSGLCLGLFKPGSNQAVLPISECHLQPGIANELLLLVGQLCEQAGLQPYDPRTRRGLLQAVVIRTAAGASASTSSRSRGSGYAESSPAEVMLNFVSARDGRGELARLVQAIVQQFPSVVSIVNSVSDALRPAGERAVAAEHLLHGRPYLLESVCGLDFEVSANSFFQTNTRQAELLYQLVAEAAELQPSDVVLDLYCGTGTIALSLARRCREVYGVEVVETAVADAKRNAARNGIDNARFLLGDLEQPGAAELLWGQVPQPDVVVVDPARPGLSPAVIAFLRQCGARRLVYVSCNPATQARDVALLCAQPAGAAEAVAGGGSAGDVAEAQYRLAWVQPCDMFPQTMHVEAVAVLDRVGSHLG